MEANDATCWQNPNEQDPSLATTIHYTIHTDDFLAVSPAVVWISGETSNRKMKWLTQYNAELQHIVFIAMTILIYINIYQKH